MNFSHVPSSQTTPSNSNFPGTAAPAFPFESPQMQMRFIAALVDRACEFNSEIWSTLQPKYFTRELGGIFAFVRQSIETYGRAPQWDFIEHYFGVDGTASLVVKQMRQLSTLPADAALLTSQAIEWARQHEAHSMFQKALALWRTGKPNDALEYVTQETQRIDQISARPSCVYDLVENPETNAPSKSIPTFLFELNKYMGGGLHEESLGIVMAATGEGKGVTLANLGFTAADAQHRVLHIAMEDGAKRTQKRYSDLARRVGGDDAYKQMLAHLRPRLKIAPLPERFIDDGRAKATVEDIRILLNDLERTKSWKPDLVIFDYADLLIGGDKYQKSFERQEAGIYELKNLATKKKFAVWTAVQINRDGLAAKKGEPNASKLAGSIARLNIADIFLSLQRYHGSSYASLRVEKYRDGEKGKMFHLHFDYPRLSGWEGPPPEGVGTGPPPEKSPAKKKST